MLKVVTSVANETEAELICSRLREAGIAALNQRSIGGPEWGSSGGRNVYVEERDLERARELLEPGEISDDELAQLSEQAYRDATGDDPPGS